MTSLPTARYYVYDRAETQASHLTRFSAVNARYWILDRTTGKVVDEASTKRGALDAARLYNTGAVTP